MALKATIHKAQLGIADIDRGYYAEHALTLARHPSETDERLMVRLLAFMLFASPQLEFGRGLCAPEEPDLSELQLDGRSVRWIKVGLPDARAVKRGGSSEGEVIVLAYGDQARRTWWPREGPDLMKLPRLRVLALEPTETQALSAACTRNMRWQCTVQEGELLLVAEHASPSFSLSLRPETLFSSAG
jgi:uncharacterized protein YaeQ